MTVGLLVVSLLVLLLLSSWIQERVSESDGRWDARPVEAVLEERLTRMPRGSGW